MATKDITHTPCVAHSVRANLDCNLSLIERSSAGGERVNDCQTLLKLQNIYLATQLNKPRNESIGAKAKLAFGCCSVLVLISLSTAVNAGSVDKQKPPKLD